MKSKRKELVERWSGEWTPWLGVLGDALRTDPEALLDTDFPRVEGGLLDLRGLPKSELPSLCGKTLSSADLTHTVPVQSAASAKFVKVKLGHIEMPDWLVPSAAFHDVTFERVRFYNFTFGGVDGQRGGRPIYRNCRFVRCEFDYCGVTDATVEGCIFEDCSFGRARSVFGVRGTVMRGCRFERCSFVWCVVGVRGRVFADGALLDCTFENCRIARFRIQRGVDVADLGGEVLLVPHSLPEVLEGVVGRFDDRATLKQLTDFKEEARELRKDRREWDDAALVEEKALFTRSGFPVSDKVLNGVWEALEAEVSALPVEPRRRST